MKLLLPALLLVTATATADDLPVYAFRNGHWWDGHAFHRATVYAVDGHFTFKKPARVDRSIDLENTFVLPPFAEAHNHNLTSPGLVDEMGPAYLREGVFYAKMQSNLPQFTGVIRHRLNRRDSVDVDVCEWTFDGNRRTPRCATAEAPGARCLSRVYEGVARDARLLPNRRQSGSRIDVANDPRISSRLHQDGVGFLRGI